MMVVDVRDAVCTYMCACVLNCVCTHNTQITCCHNACCIKTYKHAHLIASVGLCLCIRANIFLIENVQQLVKLLQSFVFLNVYCCSIEIKINRSDQGWDEDKIQRRILFVTLSLCALSHLYNSGNTNTPASVVRAHLLFPYKCTCSQLWGKMWSWDLCLILTQMFNTFRDV